MRLSAPWPLAAALGAAVSLTSASAVELTPCTGDELAGKWLIQYELQTPEHCTFAVDSDGSITESACFARNKRKLRETLQGTVAVDEACAVTGDLALSRPTKNPKAHLPKGKYGPFSLSGQLSEDRSIVVGTFEFRRRTAPVVAIRTQ